MTSSPPLLSRLAERLTALAGHGSDAPPPWAGAAELCWLDWGIVTLYGLGHPVAVRAARAVGGLRPLLVDVRGGRGGSPEGRVPAALRSLAFLLGTAGHAAELDDTLPGCMVHAGVPVVSAAAATGFWLGRSGPELLEAIAVGYEVVDRVGRAINAPPSLAVHARGFHPTGVLGPLGAAAASARLMGLDRERFAHALALATSMGGGLLEFFTGGDAKPLHTGRAAADGILAAALARSGLEGSTRAFEGRDGFFRAYAGDAWNPSPLVEDGAPEGLAVHRTLRKYHACCHHCHAAVETWRRIRREDPFDPDAVVSVEVALPPMAAYQVGQPPEAKRRPTTPTEARFSLPYALAAWTVLGHLAPAAFEPVHLADGRIRRLSQRITVRPDLSMDEAFARGQMPARVAVRLQDGRSLEASLALGSPPAGEERSRLREKAQALLSSPGEETAAEAAWSVLERSARDGPEALFEFLGSFPPKGGDPA